MAWLPMYLLTSDVEFLNDWLNQEEEIAFLASNGDKRWIAKKEHSIIPDIGTQSSQYDEAEFEVWGNDIPDLLIPNFVEYWLWHIPSGPLPLIKPIDGSAKVRLNKEDWDDEKVDNPWMGWTELTTGANPRMPYFGPGHPGTFHLEIRVPSEKEIPMSTFGWIGNYYRILGNGASPTTEKFWNKLRKMAKKIATQIPMRNDSSLKKEVFAFPGAYKEIQNGCPAH